MKLSCIEDLKKLLINNDHTEYAPLNVEQGIVLSYRLNQAEFGGILGTIEVQYLYIKNEILFVANSRFDEVSMDCIDFQSINYLLSTLIINS